MERFIVFRLYGPLAAWGDIAVGEQRPTATHPSKSAVLGLVAAALGIRRSDDDAHEALRDSLGFAVRVQSGGVPLRDYHTSQYPKSVSRLKHLHTRRDELLDPHNRIASLSTRDYRTDGLYTVCLHERMRDSRATAETIVSSLLKPTFAPYLGRRSCPTAFPLSPRLIEAHTVVAAIAHYDETDAGNGRAAFLDELGLARLARERGIYWEDGVPAGLRPSRSIPRHDQPMSRTRRQFAPRTEHYSASEGD
ncbi:MAG: type I-E CRISPR-associated protein Cas5/CasD [Thiohalocapsa sp.]|nr:type I-E CRISPR-associated protein Cas5/CasD [Thiohalocapsa sp.]